MNVLIHFCVNISMSFVTSARCKIGYFPLGVYLNSHSMGGHCELNGCTWLVITNDTKSKATGDLQRLSILLCMTDHCKNALNLGNTHILAILKSSQMLLQINCVFGVSKYNVDYERQMRTTHDKTQRLYLVTKRDWVNLVHLEQFLELFHV